VAGVTELAILTIDTLGGIEITGIDDGKIVLGPIVIILTEGGIYTYVAVEAIVEMTTGVVGGGVVGTIENGLAGVMLGVYGGVTI